MTFEDAMHLTKGDYVIVGRHEWKKYKVLYVREERGVTGNIYAIVKCRRGNDICWAFHNEVEKYENEKEI